jgi:hypothetical protein
MTIDPMQMFASMFGGRRKVSVSRRNGKIVVEIDPKS